MSWLSSMLEDGIDGSLSSKRVITLLAFLLCATAFIANLFFGLKIEAFIFDSMSYIAMAGLGVTVAEKFAVKRVDPPRPYQPTYQPPTQYYQPRVHGTPLPKQEDPLI